MLFRRQFYNDISVLRQMGLNTRRRSEPVPSEMEDGQTINPDEPTETRKVAVSRSHNEAVRLMHWRKMLNGMALLPPEAQDLITVFGFNETRLEQIRQAVEAFAAAIPAKNLALAERKERIRLINLTEKQLYTWLITIRAIIAPKTRQIRLETDTQTLALMAM